MFNDEIDSLIEEAFVNDDSTSWIDSPFEKLIIMSNDARGRWGERLACEFLNLADIPYKWNADCNNQQPDGIYDIKVDQITRIEVKTAASFKNWQHEPIYAAPVWDVLFLIDIAFDKIFLTILKRDDLLPILVPGKSQHILLGKGATLRKNKDDGYKFDFSPKTIANGLQNELTFEYDYNDPDITGLIAFIREGLYE